MPVVEIESMRVVGRSMAKVPERAVVVMSLHQLAHGREDRPPSLSDHGGVFEAFPAQRSPGTCA